MFASKNSVESRVVRMFWNDGLLDVLAGSGLVLMGVAWLLDLVPLGAIGPAILIPMWKPLRSRFTEPRLGYVEFSDTQQRRNRTFLAVAMGLGVATLVGGVVVYMAVVNRLEILTPRTVPALPACLIGFMALMTAAATSQVRFVGYALALCLYGIVVAVLQLEPGWALLAGGITVVIGGAIMLSHFLNRYPLPVEAK